MKRTTGGGHLGIISTVHALLCFVVVWYWSVLFLSFISAWITSLPLGQPYDCPQASVKQPWNMGKSQNFAADCRYTDNKTKQIKTMVYISWEILHTYIDGLVQDRRNSIANALDFRLSCIRPSIWCICKVQPHYNTFINVYNTKNRYPWAHPRGLCIQCFCNVEVCSVLFVIAVLCVITYHKTYYSGARRVCSMFCHYYGVCSTVP